MSPIPSTYDEAYAGLGNSKLIRELCLRHARTIQPADLANVVCRYLGLSISLTLCCPTLEFAVGHIVGLRSKLQMIWVYASRCVASMQKDSTIRDCSKPHLPRSPMRQDEFSRFPASDLAVSHIVEGSIPEPASVFGLIDKREKFASEVPVDEVSLNGHESIAVPPFAHIMCAAHTDRTGGFTAPRNATYRNLSHGDVLSSLWLEPVAALERSAGSLILAARVSQANGVN